MKKKLVLGSGGIFFENESDPILDHIFGLIDVNTEHKKMVYLPTAGHDSRDDEEKVNDYCHRHGFEEVVHLYLTDMTLSDAYIRDTILSASVIYARGGNLRFLLETWRRRGADKYLKEAYERGIVLAGQSSGAMCWCRRGYDDCGENDAYLFLDGLDLIPYVLCPHFEDWQCFLTDVKRQDLDALAIDNDIDLSIVNNTYSVVDSHRNPKHSAFFIPAAEGFRKIIDLQKEHVALPGITCGG